MFKIFAYLFVAACLTYFLFYPWLRHSVNRKKIFKWFMIAYGLAMLASAVSTYMMGSSVPDSFTAGVAQIKNRRDIKYKIGDFKELVYKKKDLPSANANPAELKFELEGSKGILLIESTVTKDANGNWQVTALKKDSLLVKF